VFPISGDDWPHFGAFAIVAALAVMLILGGHISTAATSAICLTLLMAWSNSRQQLKRLRGQVWDIHISHACPYIIAGAVNELLTTKNKTRLLGTYL
jgi:cytochrome P450